MTKIKSEFDNETKYQTWADGTLEKLNVHFVHISSKNKYVRKGLLDLMCWYKGKSFVIELKVSKNKLMPDQEKERDRFIEQDIRVYVTYNQEQFLNALKSELIIK